MDILITLPKELISDILSGKKKVELRKTSPIYFNENSNYVFVVEKGTKNIRLYFTITKFESIIVNNENLWYTYKKYQELISIKWRWFERYYRNSIYMCLWHIGTTTELTKTLPPHIKNPQAFIYLTEKDVANLTENY